MARIADLRQHPSKKLPLVKQQNFAVGGTIRQFTVSPDPEGAALSWRANGLAYGIPAEIDEWLASGEQVLVNGSRGYLATARERYPDLLAVLLSVEQDVLRQRLHARGRETAEQIESRLARNALFAGELDDYIRLDNSTPLSESVERLLALIEEHVPRD